MTIDAIEPNDLEVQAPTAGAVSIEEDEVSDSSPDSGDNHEEKTEDVNKREQTSDRAEKRINELTAKRYEAERRAEAVEAKLRELEANKPAQVVEVDGAPELPDDLYDDDAMRKYHAEMAKYNRKVAEEAGKSAYQRQKEAEAQAAQQGKQQEELQAYISNAQRDGVDLEKLRAAEKALLDANINPALGQHLMSDPNGAKIAAYLHDNPSEMYEVLSLSPMMAAVKIDREIKAKALSTTPKVSNAPEPIKPINGGGYIEKDDFDKKYPSTEFI